MRPPRARIALAAAGAAAVAVAMAVAGSPATAPTDLRGYSVQYISASPGSATNWQVTPLSGTVPAGKHFLVGEAAGTGATAGLPTPDATGGINLCGTAGTVALVHSTTAPQGATVGPLDYSNFGGYVLQASTLGPSGTTTWRR